MLQMNEPVKLTTRVSTGTLGTSGRLRQYNDYSLKKKTLRVFNRHYY